KIGHLAEERYQRAVAVLLEPRLEGLPALESLRILPNDGLVLRPCAHAVEVRARGDREHGDRTVAVAGVGGERPDRRRLARCGAKQLLRRGRRGGAGVGVRGHGFTTSTI